MTKKIIEFPLKHAVKLVPIKGETQVEVVTNGDVLIKDSTPSPDPQPRSILLAESIYGRLTSSPGGMNHTVKIILPANMATRENFLLEVHSIFDNLFLEKKFGI